MRLFLRNRIALSVLVVLLGLLDFVNNQSFLIDQRYRDKNRLQPPEDQFFKTFYDKSYYIPGSQKPVYNVIESI